MKYQTIEELKAHLEAMNDRVINFGKYPEYKSLEYRDKCMANFGSTGNITINNKRGDFYGKRV